MISGFRDLSWVPNCHQMLTDSIRFSFLPDAIGDEKPITPNECSQEKEESPSKPGNKAQLPNIRVQLLTNALHIGCPKKSFSIKVMTKFPKNEDDLAES